MTPVWPLGYGPTDCETCGGRGYYHDKDQWECYCECEAGRARELLDDGASLEAVRAGHIRQRMWWEARRCDPFPGMWDEGPPTCAAMYNRRMSEARFPSTVDSAGHRRWKDVAGAGELALEDSGRLHLYAGSAHDSIDLDRGQARALAEFLAWWAGNQRHEDEHGRLWGHEWAVVAYIRALYTRAHFETGSNPPFYEEAERVISELQGPKP